MPSVLFICTANQFRSPLAAAFFEKRLEEKDMAEGWTVSSAGIWVKGKCGAHPAAQLAAEKAGLDLSRHVTREVTHSMLAAADLVLVMEHGQKEALHFEFADQRKKIFMLTELSGRLAIDIPDPVKDGFAKSDQIASILFTGIDRVFDGIIKRAGGAAQKTGETSGKDLSA